MSRTVHNLEIQSHKSVDEEALDSIREMAGGLPFEKQREHLLGLDREKLIGEYYGTAVNNRDFLIARFGEKLVGALGVTRLPNSGTETLIAEHELVQRNRDDIRGQILAELSQRYPGARLFIQYPAQNRTARQFLRRETSFTIEEESVYLYYHWPIGETNHSNWPAFSRKEIDGANELLQSPIERLISHDRDFPSLSSLPWSIESHRIELTPGPEIELITRPYPTTENVTSHKIWGLNQAESKINPEDLFEGIETWAKQERIDHLEWAAPGSAENTIKETKGPFDAINKRIQLILSLGGV